MVITVNPLLTYPQGYVRAHTQPTDGTLNMARCDWIDHGAALAKPGTQSCVRIPGGQWDSTRPCCPLRGGLSRGVCSAAGAPLFRGAPTPSRGFESRLP